MTTEASVPQAASIWARATRITPLDAQGNIITGVNSFVSDTLVKATLTPVYEAGDDIALKGASGELVVYAKHGDIPKRWSISIELGLPDPYLQAALAGGTLLGDNSEPLGAPSAAVVHEYSGGGTIPAGTLDYATSCYNQYGETEISPDETVALGAIGHAVISPNMLSGALGAIVYGRGIGQLYRLGSVLNITGQHAAAAAGTITTVTLTALTQPIPAGFKFTITGDTNTPPVVFTTASAAGIGEVIIEVNSVVVATAIASGLIIPVFVDDGSVTPSGLPSSADNTGGPGANVGWQSEAMGAVGNPNGVSLEFFADRIQDGTVATDWPFFRHVIPMAKNLHKMPMDVTNANLATIFEGDVFQNPHWGSGPDGTWQFDSSKVYQFAVCGAEIVPTPSVAPVPAEY
jgi:hypothetical protein